jgi:hypothetical protein
MRIRLDLNIETTTRLVAIALAERRTAADQAQVILEEALGLRGDFRPEEEQRLRTILGLVTEAEEVNVG